MSAADEIEKLNKLKTTGAITDEEFQEAKRKLLSQENKTSTKAPLDINQYCLIIHLSQLSNFVIPLAGIVFPIVLWQIKKHESELINTHGKNVTNWIITSSIFYIIFGLLCFVLIGIPLLFALCIASVVFTIMGGIKANDGVVWKYPMTINFIK